MKRSILFISAVFMLVAVATFTFASPAFAKEDVGGGNFWAKMCARAGGTWTESGNTATCSYSLDHWKSQKRCESQYYYVGTFKYISKFTKGENTDIGRGRWMFNGGKCKLWTGSYGASSTNVTNGEPADAWSGNCGVFISIPPVNGSIVVNKAAWATSPNLQTTCQVKYFDFEGNSLDKFGSPGWVYYNLNAETAKLWNEGQLNMYIFKNKAWENCSNPVFVNAGTFGRIACYAETPIYFGIGTGINSLSSETFLGIQD